MWDLLIALETVDIVLLVAALAALAFGVWQMTEVQADLRVDVRDDLNSDEEAEALFLRLVKGTDCSLLIHDDGDDDPDSVYNQTSVLNALETGIRKRGIRVRCLFNERANLDIVKLAQSFPQNVTIRYRKEGRPEDDIHYKIVDGGKMLHLSLHDRGDHCRRYQLRDATNAPPRAKRRMLGDYLERFEEDMRRAAAR